jgi:hypothetical protein
MNELLDFVWAILGLVARLARTSLMLVLCVPIVLACFVVVCLEPLWQHPGNAER